MTRSLIYYKHKRNKESEIAIDNAVIQIFRDSRNNYGTRKIKKALEKQNIILSRRKIGEIMNFNKVFGSLEELQMELFDYVN